MSFRREQSRRPESSIRRRKEVSRRIRSLKFEQLEQRRVLAFYDSFENGLLSSWSILDNGGEGRVQIRDLYAEGIISNSVSKQFGEPNNRYALAFDSTRASGDSSKDLAIAILQVDLSDMTDAVLTFHQFEANDLNDVLPDQHATSTPGDGLSISRDGLNWYRLINIDGFDLNRSGDGLWQLHEFDLGREFERLNADYGAGLQFDQNIRLKFSQYDSRSLPSHGWAIDELRIAAEANPFSLNHPRGAFHRFNVAGENDDDYYFRAAVYGDANENTPILVSVHGTAGDTNISSYAWRWHQFVADPANQVESLIVVMPSFVENVTPGRFNTETRYSALSWNTSTDAAADLVLLETVEAIASTGVGDPDRLRLWGFSAGGQFVGRFTAAHAAQVGAAVVGGPSSQILPTTSISYPHGIGQNAAYPPPPGVAFDLDAYLRTPVMYWVGQNDSDPNHAQLERNPSIDSAQGISRRERAIYQFEQMHLAAERLQLAPLETQIELLISEGDGHGWSSEDLHEIYEFLFRKRDVQTASVRIHPRLVFDRSSHERSSLLPQTIDRIVPGQPFFVELWVEAPSGSEIGVVAGQLEVFFDTDLADVVGIEHGMFTSGATGLVDETAGRIRNFGGATDLSQVGVGEYALFGRIQMQAGGASLDAPVRWSIAIQPSEPGHFVLEDGVPRKIDFMPVPAATIGGILQGVRDGIVQGIVFDDRNADGIRQSPEPGIPNRELVVRQPDGTVVAADFHLEPDESLGHGAYLSGAHPWVSLSAVGSDTLNPAVRAYLRDSAESSTGSHVFATNVTGGFTTQWVENLRSLRMDFAAPTSTVSIDIIAKLDDNRDFGRLEVFNSQGTLLESTRSSDLADGAFETVTISRPAADIAYAIATGAGGNNVRLDNLHFTSQLRAQTDGEGNYAFQNISPGDYGIDLLPVNDWFTTWPAGGQQAVSVGSAATEVGYDFGSSQKKLTLAIVPGTISEQGGSASATVTRADSDLSQPLIVSLSSSLPDEANGPPTVTIDAGSASKEFSISALDDTVLDGNHLVTMTASAIGYLAAQGTVDVSDHETLSLSVNPLSIVENGVADATVTRNNTDRSLSLVVNLTTNDPETGSVPLSVTIPANQGSASFQITALNNSLVEGAKGLSVSAAASGYVPGSIELEVIDDDIPALSMTIELASVPEIAGPQAARVTIQRNGDLANELKVSLASNDLSEIEVPNEVLIAAGQPFVEFHLIAVDDNLLDGTQTVMITAMATGYVSASQNVLVTDVNKAPIAQGQTITTDEDSEVLIALAGSDGDDGGDQNLSFVLTSLPVPGILSLESQGNAIVASDLPLILPGNTVHFRPAANETTSQSFVFEVRDDGGVLHGGRDVSPPATVAVQIIPINDAPLLADLEDMEVPEGSPVEITVAASDVDVVGDLPENVEVSIVSGRRDGMTLDGQSGAFHWTPSEFEDGEHIIAFRATDQHGLAGQDKSLTIMVTEINEPPTIDSLDNRSVTELELVEFNLVARDHDVINSAPDMVSVSIAAGAQSGMNFDAGSGQFSWRPSDTQAGNYSITFRGTDLAGATSEQTIQIIVAQLNRSPNDLDVSPLLLEEGIGGAVVGVVTVADPDAEQNHRFEVSDERFEVAGNELKLQPDVTVDFETEKIIQVTITVIDSGLPPMSLEVEFAISVVDGNDVPTSISLDQFPVQERIAGATIGTLGVADPDQGQQHVFSVTDSRFEIAGEMLRLKPERFLAGDSTSVDVTVSDSGNPSRSLTQSITIDIQSNAFPWRNRAMALDTNGDRQIVPLDALRIINQLNNPTILAAGGRLPEARPVDSALPFYDTNGDGFCTSNDVLRIVNHLNQLQSGEGEGGHIAHDLSHINEGILVTQERSMSYADTLLPEFDHEMASTRKVLEVVPDEKLDWRASSKSNSIGWNANHLAEIPGWVEPILTQDAWDFAPEGGPRYQSPSFTSRKEILDLFDRNVAAARKILQQANDDEMSQTWSLLQAGATILSMPRTAIMRSFIMNHLIHHRAHLCAYLRMNDIAVPGMYGPS